MASGRHTVNNNFCNQCLVKISNGIIRDGNIYCSDNCYKQWFEYCEPTHNVHVGSNNRRISSMPTPTPSPPARKIVEKQCNYCFETFDMSNRCGIPYGPMWFCCQQHLNLANPRPKVQVVSGPIIGVPHVVGPHIVGVPHVVGPHIIGVPRVAGPFFGPHIVGSFFPPF